MAFPLPQVILSALQVKLMEANVYGARTVDQALSQAPSLNCYKAARKQSFIIAIWQMRELRLVHSYKVARDSQKQVEAMRLRGPTV